MSIAVIVCASWSLLALLQAKRRNDPGYLLWLFACAGWITGAMITFALHCDWLTDSNWQWLAGVLVLVGGVWLPVNAMLVKIIPFLVFLHLRRRLPARSKIPPMQMLLPVKQARWQAKAQIVCLLLLLAIPLQTGPLRASCRYRFCIHSDLAGGIIVAGIMEILGVAKDLSASNKVDFPYPKLLIRILKKLFYVFLRRENMFFRKSS
jgi:MFS family permease